MSNARYQALTVLPPARRELGHGFSIGFENVGEETPGVSHPHAHEPAYFSFVTHGVCAEKIESWPFEEIVPWSLTFHPSGETHARRTSSAGYGAFGMVVPDTILSDLEAELGSKLPPMNLPSSAWLTKRIADEWMTPGPISDLVLTGLLYEALALTAKTPPQEKHLTTWLRRAREVVHENPTFTLADVALEVGISPTHLAREFRRCFGCSVGEYGRAIRLDKARQALREAQVTISHVAVEYGFFDEAHFGKAFKSMFGVTPGNYRKSPF